MQVYSASTINEKSFICFYSFKESDYENYKYSFNFVVENLDIEKKNEGIFIYFIDQNNNFSKLKIILNFPFNHENYQYKNTLWMNL